MFCKKVCQRLGISKGLCSACSERREGTRHGAEVCSSYCASTSSEDMQEAGVEAVPGSDRVDG